MKRATAGVTAALLVTAAAHALPEYQVRYNQTCALCHYNPTGGGIRTEYGAQFFSYSDLPVNKLEFEQIRELSPRINDRLQYGLDLRGVYALRHDWNEDGDGEVEGNEFVLMQGDAYFAYAMSDVTNVVLDISLRGVEEAFADFTFYNGKLRVRAGQYRSTYGWGFVDHTLFVRRFLGYGSLRGPGTRAYDSGMEAGVYLQRYDLTVGASNGSPGTAGNAYHGRFARRFQLGNLTATLGASGRVTDLGAGTFSPWHAGAFYGSNFGRFTFLGETDLLAETEGTTGLVASHLLRFTVRRGVYVNGWYEYYDPDLDYTTGHGWRVRAGIDFVPFGYFSVSPMYEWNYADYGAFDDERFGQFLVQLHLWR
ncbi:MAG: hypothetical protein MAG453_01202 [Calditrichaeota bacterium]|nr:hypothetical protein [Calditrichota bacterium]